MVPKFLVPKFQGSLSEIEAVAWNLEPGTRNHETLNP